MNEIVGPVVAFYLGGVAVMLQRVAQEKIIDDARRKPGPEPKWLFLLLLDIAIAGMISVWPALVLGYGIVRMCGGKKK